MRIIHFRYHEIIHEADGTTREKHGVEWLDFKEACILSPFTVFAYGMIITNLIAAVIIIVLRQIGVF
jgi:hypothetical protein